MQKPRLPLITVRRQASNELKIQFFRTRLAPVMASQILHNALDCALITSSSPILDLGGIGEIFDLDVVRAMAS